MGEAGGAGSEQKSRARAGRPRGALARASLLFRVGVSVGVLAAAAGIAALLIGSKGEIARSQASVSPPIVSAVVAQARSVPRVWEGYATVRAMGSADVAAEVAGRVVERPEGVEPGFAVKAGGLIVALEPLDFAQRVAQGEHAVAGLEAELAGLAAERVRLAEQAQLARAERDAAQRDYDRVLEASGRGAGTASEVDRALTGLRASERALSGVEQALEVWPSREASVQARLAAESASLRIAREELSRARITSPIGGVLQSVGPRLGERVSVGQVVARVVDLSRVEVPLRLAVSAAAHVRLGDEAELRTDGDGPALWSGRITRIAPEADAAARTVTAFVEVEQDPSAPGALLPGQFVVGRVATGGGGERLVVPRRAVEADRVLLAVAGPGGAEEGSASAWVVTPVDVRVAYYAQGRLPEIDPEETEWAVLEPAADGGPGIAPGAVVIVSNLDQLRAGMVVQVRTPAEPAALGGVGP